MEQYALSPVNRLLDEFFRSLGESPLRRGEFTPRINLVESDQELRISAELPGVNENDVEVTFADGYLIIRGEKKAEEEERDGESFYRLERLYGAFQRAIPLPVEVEADNIQATFKKGVLTVTLPKAKPAASSVKKIAVKSE